MKKFLLCISACLVSVLGMTILTSCGDNYRNDYYPDRVFQEMRTYDNSRSESTDVRIMTANTLVHVEGGYGGMPVEPRAQLFAEAMIHYAPDVVGLQEFCGDWIKKLAKVEDVNGDYVMKDYALLHKKSSKWTNIMYNTTTLNLIESGLIKYDEHTNSNCRLISWGLFETKATKEKFIVTSTHWDFGEGKKDIVTSQANQMADHVQYLIDTYKVPVYQTGDFNMFREDILEGEESYQQAEMYKLYLELSKSSNVKDSFDNVQKLTLGKYIDKEGVAADINFDSEQWDYIFIRNAETTKSGPVKVEILHNFYFQSISDHPLMYADIDFNADNKTV